MNFGGDDELGCDGTGPSRRAVTSSKVTPLARYALAGHDRRFRAASSLLVAFCNMIPYCRLASKSLASSKRWGRSVKQGCRIYRSTRTA